MALPSSFISRRAGWSSIFNCFKKQQFDKEHFKSRRPKTATETVADEDFQLASQPAKIIRNNKRHMASSKSATIFDSNSLDKVNAMTGVFGMLQIDCVFDADAELPFFAFAMAYTFSLSKT